MAMNHQISSKTYDRYHGAVKAKELRSQNQHEHGSMHVGHREEGSKLRPKLYDSFDRAADQAGRNKASPRLYDDVRNIDYRRSERDQHIHDRSFEHKGFKGHGPQHLHKEPSLFRDSHYGLTGPHGFAHGPMQSRQFTKITITHSVVFKGIHLGSLDKRNEAYQKFMDAARSFLDKPGDKSYKALNDAMTKLMDSKFTPSVIGGGLKVDFRSIKGARLAKFTMEVTPSPVKTLEEAREDLKNVYSSKRDGEKGIAGIRAEAYTNYIRALSEQFKKTGVINHTNHTPTTPVFKSSVIYIVKVTQINAVSLREIGKPQFGHHPHGRFMPKHRHGFWNGHRPQMRSYVDMIKYDSVQSDIHRHFGAGKAMGAKHDHHHSAHGKIGASGYHHGPPSYGKAQAAGHHGSPGHGKAQAAGHHGPPKAPAGRAS